MLSSSTRRHLVQKGARGRARRRLVAAAAEEHAEVLGDRAAGSVDGLALAVEKALQHERGHRHAIGRAADPDPQRQKLSVRRLAAVERMPRWPPSEPPRFTFRRPTARSRSSWSSTTCSAVRP